MNPDRIDQIKRYLRGRIAVYGPNAFVPDAPPIQKSVSAPVAPDEHSVPKSAMASKPAKTKPPTMIREDALKFPAPAAVSIKNTGSTVSETWISASDLNVLNVTICACLNCSLGNTRTKFVFGVGNPNANLVIIGEAPGKDEDEKGEPFVGRAGKLLNDILKAINFQREEVYICNILKCRPPGNRDPLPAEVEQCEPYLHKQLDLIQPKIILALGRIAANTLLKTNLTLRELRTTTHEFHGIPMMATYHPAALLRNPAWKRDTWEDVQKLRAKYDELVGTKK